MWIPQAPPKGYNFDPEATDSLDDGASLSRWSFRFWKILCSAHSRPFRVSTGCGLKAPQHLIWSGQLLKSSTHSSQYKNTQQHSSYFWACLCVLKSFQVCGTTILSYHQPFCPISSRGQGHCWNILTSLLLSVDVLHLRFWLFQISGPTAFVSAPIIGQK